MQDIETVLVRVSGEDRPGITAGLLEILSEAEATVLDMEQFIVRGRLTLDLVVDIAEWHNTFRDLLFFGWQRDLQIDFETVPAKPPPMEVDRYAVSVIATRLTARDMAGVANAIATSGSNIDRIVRLSDYPVMSFELIVSGGDSVVLRRELWHHAGTHNIDVALQPEVLQRRARRLVVLDVDSTLIQNEMVDLLATEAGAAEPVAALTERAMAGELDFEASLRERVSALEGLEVDALERVIAAIELTPGARTFVRTLKRLGFTIALVSGGFSFVTDWLAKELDVDFSYANHLEVTDGRLTGGLLGPVVDRPRKAELLREIALGLDVPVEQTVAVGDGANDVDMLAAAGMGIAFQAKPGVEEAADTAVTVPYLDAILFLLGIRRDEVVAADRADPSLPVD